MNFSIDDRCICEKSRDLTIIIVSYDCQFYIWCDILFSSVTILSSAKKGLVWGDVDLRAISVKFYGHELEAESESNDYDDLPTSFSNILINLVNEGFALAKNRVHFF